MQKRNHFIWLIMAFVLSFTSVNAQSISPWAKQEYDRANQNALIPETIVYKDMHSNITRSEFCDTAMQMYFRLGGQKPKVTKSDDVFTDTDNDSVLNAYALGIVSGVTKDTFMPDREVTRQEMAKMIVNSLTAAGVTTTVTYRDALAQLDGFCDKDLINDWAMTPFTFLLKNGITKGMSDTELMPQGKATREQAIIMAERCYNKFYKSDNKGEVKPEMILNPIDGQAVKNEDLTISFTQNNKNIGICIVVRDAANDEIAYQVITANNSVVVPAKSLANGKKYMIYGYVMSDGCKIYSNTVNITVGESKPKVFYDKDKSLKIFADSDMSSKELADKEQVMVTVKVWKLIGGEKIASTESLAVHKAIVEDVKQIFDEIYNGEEKFPIKDVGAYSWRAPMASGRLSEHNYGTAIDINSNENYCIYNDGTTIGSYWKPGEDPYSIKEDGDVVNAFKNHGWTWGGKAWSNPHDYMHFSYMGT